MCGCEFQVFGLRLGKPERIPCGKPGARMICIGSLSTIRVVLCERHLNHCRTKYGWRCEPDATKDEGTTQA